LVGVEGLEPSKA